MAIKASTTITISKYRDTDSVTRYYKLQASTAAAPAKPTTLEPNGWSKTEPSYTSGSTNTLYFVDRSVFSDGTFSYSEVSISSSYEAAKEAYNKAKNAQDSLDNLEIGGTNLLLGTKRMTNWNTSGTKNTDDEFTEVCITQSDKTANAILFLNPVNKIEKEIIDAKPIIISFELKVDDYSKWDVKQPFIWEAYKSDKADGGDRVGYTDIAITDSRVTYDKDKLENGEWTKVIFKTICNRTSFKGFVAGETWDTCTHIGLRFTLFRNGSIHFRKAKFEIGNKETDWSPSPDDVEESVNSVVDKANEALRKATTAVSTVDSLNGIIQNLVTGGGKYVSIDSTADGIQINMGELTKSIDEMMEQLKNTLSEADAAKLKEDLLDQLGNVNDRTKYITADDNGPGGSPRIVLGDTGSPFKVEITNQSINFLQNNEVIAYANGNAFFNLRTVVQQDIQIGLGPGYMWKTRSNGNMGLIYIP